MGTPGVTVETVAGVERVGSAAGCAWNRRERQSQLGTDIKLYRYFNMDYTVRLLGIFTFQV